MLAKIFLDSYSSGSRPLDGLQFIGSLKHADPKRPESPLKPGFLGVGLRGFEPPTFGLRDRQRAPRQEATTPEGSLPPPTPQRQQLGPPTHLLGAADSGYEQLVPVGVTVMGYQPDSLPAASPNVTAIPISAAFGTG